MTKEKSPARQGPRYIFYFLMLAILGWFIFMQFFGADERTVSGNSPSLLYPGTFTWEKSDGTTEEITVPGSYDVPAGETMVITRSTERASRYNDGIRRYVLGAEEEIESGDLLMVVKNNYHFTERTEDCPMNFLANGDIAELRRLRRFEDFYGFRFATAVLSFADYNDAELECKILLDTIASESPSLTREERSRLFCEVEKDYLDIKSKLKRFKEIRENPHFNAVQVKFAYAVTCHKAQGGQWRAVFIDRCLFGDEPMTRDMLRWLYTALTRATDKLYLVNFDERFYE